jgi:putative transposon-encoded protein
MGVDMITRYKELPSQNNYRKPENTGKATRTRFTITGEEIIDKEVRPSGNSGRIYLPLDWVGKHVKVIRID